MAHLRPAFVASVSVVAMIAACSSFSSERSGVDDPDASSVGDGAGPPPSSGGDASPDAPIEAGSDGSEAGGATCALDATYTNNTSGGATLVKVTKDGVPSERAQVTAANQKATLVRDLTVPADGNFVVSLTFELTASTSGVQGWDVPFLVVACTAPMVNVSLDYGPGMVLTANVSNGVAQSVGPPPPTFQTVSLAFQDSKIQVTGLAGGATLNTPDHFAGAKGCSLTIGPRAVGNVPTVDVYLAQACVY